MLRALGRVTRLGTENQLVLAIAVDTHDATVLQLAEQNFVRKRAANVSIDVATHGPRTVFAVVAVRGEVRTGAIGQLKLNEDSHASLVDAVSEVNFSTSVAGGGSHISDAASVNSRSPRPAKRRTRCARTSRS